MNVDPLPRVLMLGHLPPSTGGPATHLSAILSSGLSDQYDLRSYNIGRPPKPHVRNNFGYSALWNAGLRRLVVAVSTTARNVLGFPFTLLRLRPTIVHIHTAPYWVFWETTTYVIACRIFRIPCALQLRYSFRLFYSSSHPIARRLILWVLRKATVFVIICQDDQPFLAEVAAGLECVYLPNCVDAHVIAERCAGNFRSPGSRAEVLFLGGSDSVRKGLPELLMAIPTVLRRFPKATFRLVAVPVDLVRGDLSAEHLARCVTEGWITGLEKLDRLARADIFVLPTHGEGMPIAILEAMSAGLPIVATRVAGIPDMVRHEHEGLLIAPGDVPALTEALSLLLARPSVRSSMGQCAASRALAEYDLSVGVRNFDALYRRILRRSPAECQAGFRAGD